MVKIKNILLVKHFLINISSPSYGKDNASKYYGGNGR